jgi:hypothetical protein
MSSIFEIEHCPKVGVWVWLGYLVKRRVVLIHDLINRAHDSSVLDRPA